MSSLRKSASIAPIMKWAGGKRQLLAEIKKHLPVHYANYHEAFIGGGALFFDLMPERAVINDANAELINVYRVIQQQPDALIADLKQHKNDKDYFYQIRALDRAVHEYQTLSQAQKASRMIFLNRTCYNGLFRVNSAGQFNVPFGRYKNPNIVNEILIWTIHAYLSEQPIQMLNVDFVQALARVQANDFVYLDPPYDPLSLSANFTSYTSGGFDRKQQERLKQSCDELTTRGVKFLLSNSATPFIVDLYKDYSTVMIQAKRAINAKADGRGAIAEVLVKNYA